MPKQPYRKPNNLIRYRRRDKEDWDYSIEIRLMEVFLDKHGKVVRDDERHPLTTRIAVVKSEVKYDYKWAIGLLMDKAKELSTSTIDLVYEVDIVRVTPGRKHIYEIHQWRGGIEYGWYYSKEKVEDELYYEIMEGKYEKNQI